MNPTTAVAISGGVDSLMAAYLLKQQGHHVVGVHFLTGFESKPLNIEAIAEQVGIPCRIVDISSAFKDKVVDYFVKTYLDGKTPNPCLVCNPAIKFDLIFEYARDLGATQIATGHYARVNQSTDGHHHLLCGVDSEKDQSYFLAFLNQKLLARACFPLGNMYKKDIKHKAAAKGMRPVTRSESQDVCFIEGQSYGDFLIQNTDFKPEAGEIVNQEGEILGRHPGLHLFTVGQRRGINIPAAEPYYVLRLDSKNNRLVVGCKEDTLSTQCRVKKLNWIQPAPTKPVRINTRVRYRHSSAPSLLYPSGRSEAIVRFDQPQSAVAPGQGAVFYQGEEVLGGGFICG